jgi:hypothetical protein
MIWALLAAFITKKPPWVQALVLGVSTGLFVTALAEANDRDPVFSRVIVEVLVSGTIAGGLFYAGLRWQSRRGWQPDAPGPRWLYAIYAAVWAAALIACINALFGEGGFKVAVLAIVPLILLAPTAFQGIRLLGSRHQHA